MEVSKVLKNAWQAVEAADLPAELQEVAFREAIRILAPTADSGAGQRQNGGAGKPGGQGSNGSEGKPKEDGHGISEDESSIIAKVASETGSDQEQLSLLVQVNDGRLQVVVPAHRLGRSNSDKVRNISKIFSVVYAFGLGEDGAPVELIRAEANRLKCYDATNFSKHIASCTPEFATSGQNSNKILRPKHAGIGKFADLVNQLAGDA